MRHVCHCFIVLFMYLYNIVSGQLALLLLINDRNSAAIITGVVMPLVLVAYAV